MVEVEVVCQSGQPCSNRHLVSGSDLWLVDVAMETKFDQLKNDRHVTNRNQSVPFSVDGFDIECAFILTFFDAGSVRPCDFGRVLLLDGL